MKRMLINAVQVELLRVAMVQNRSLYDLIVERAGFEQKVGNIYKAKITSIEPSLDAVFVDYGSERHGFLPLKEISRDYFLQDSGNYHERPDIRKVLKLGQELMIQVEKEERGNKGAALTTFISLAGSYLVLMPNNPRAGGISRRIEGEERDELKENISQLNIPDGMGLIVRTAGVGKSKDEMQWDLDVLLSHWKAIDKAWHDRSGPFLIHQEGDLVIRAIRDYLRADISELLIDNREVYEKACQYIEQVRPDFLDRVKFYDESIPLFTHFEIEQQIETAYKRTVHLPSGGSIVIDHTEALVAIDINSAGATKAENIEQTALNTNLEAAEEIARQLRLRDIGGLIVIDFIDMMQFKHQREVENALLTALRLDRARVQIAKISRFGMLELSRQRLRPSLRETIQHVCPTCNGHGSVRSVESIALSILRIIEEEAMKPNTSEVQVQASSDTATFLLNEKRQFLEKIETQQSVVVFIIPNPNYQPHNYDIKRLRRTDSDASSQRHKPSYQHLQSPEVKLTASRQANERRPADEPAVKNVMPTRPETMGKSGDGLIKRLWESMFGTAEENVEEASPHRQHRHQHPTRSRRRPHQDQDRDSRGRGQQRRPDHSRRSSPGQKQDQQQSSERPQDRTQEEQDTRQQNQGRRSPQERRRGGRGRGSAQTRSTTSNEPESTENKPFRRRPSDVRQGSQDATTSDTRPEPGNEALTSQTSDRGRRAQPQRPAHTDQRNQDTRQRSSQPRTSEAHPKPLTPPPAAKPDATDKRHPVKPAAHAPEVQQEPLVVRPKTPTDTTATVNKDAPNTKPATPEAPQPKKTSTPEAPEPKKASAQASVAKQTKDTKETENNDN